MAPDPARVERTTCCVVGAGPAGAVLALLLARAGIPVVLLEAHHDFDREFRGDTVHPSAMEILDGLGLAEAVLQLRHEQVPVFGFTTEDRFVATADFSRLRTRFPYITLVHQADLLELLTREAARCLEFTLVMGAHVQELATDEGGVVRGVRYRDGDGWHELRALLVVGADGRASMTRRLARLDAVSTSPEMDVLWFRLPLRPSDPQPSGGRFSPGRFVATFNRGDYWQLGYVLPKGGYPRLRAAGLDALRRGVVEAAPHLADRVHLLRDWKDASLLSVESSRLRRWYRPGLLLIGDAAHVMSPVGGVGINYAIQDAVAAADILEPGLRAGRLSLRDLAAVQRRREPPTRAIQAVQTRVQRVLLETMDVSRPVRLSRSIRLLIRVPGMRTLVARLVAYGLRPSRLPDRWRVPPPVPAHRPEAGSVSVRS